MCGSLYFIDLVGTLLAFPIDTLNKRNAEDFTLDVGWNSQMPGRDRDERSFYAPPSSRSPWNSSRFSPDGSYGRNKQQQQQRGGGVIGPLSPPQAAQQKFSQLFANRPAINAEKARTFPVMVLSEIFPDIKVEWVEGSGRGDRQFKAEAEVQGRRFFGEVKKPFNVQYYILRNYG